MLSSIIARILRKLKLVSRTGSKDLLPVKTFNFTGSIKLNGIKLKIPVIHKTGWENLFLKDGWLSAVLKELKINNNWIVLDVGANIGQTLLRIKSLGPGINYLGFDPNPVCMYYLEMLTRSNQFHNTSLIPVGIYSETTLLEFLHYMDTDTDPSASIIKGFRKNDDIKKRTIVSVYNVGDIRYLQELPYLNLVKIDVEGAESEVLLSLKHLLSRFRPFIITEVLPVYQKENSFRLERQKIIEKLLIEFEYEIFLIRKGRNETFDRFIKINEFGVHSNIKDIDYLFSPKGYFPVNP